MTYLEKFVLYKGANRIAEYMATLGFRSCCCSGNKVTYYNHPIRNDVTIIFSDKGRAKQVIYKRNKL